jgi:hypothetical protein
MTLNGPSKIRAAFRRRAGGILLGILGLFLLGGSAAGVAAAPAPSPWPKPLGGPDQESATGVAADDEGNSFVVGTFEGQAAFDSFHLASAGGSDVFVAKLDQQAHVVWAVAVGGPGTDEGRGIALAPSGDLYVAGTFSGKADFDPGPGRTELASAGGTDAFLLRLSAKGELVWARRLGGDQADQGIGVAVAADAVWVTGSFKGAMDFKESSPPMSLKSKGGRDAFVAKLDLDGHLLWARQIGGTKDDEGRGVAAGRNGEVWVAGNFEATPSLGPEGGTLDIQSAGRSDVFLVRLDSTGRLLWSGRIGGEGEDTCEGLAATQAGGAAVIGEFWHSADVDPGPGVLSYVSHGLTDAFLVSVDGTGRMLWAWQYGEVGADLGLGVAADHFGSIYTVGYLDRRGDSLAWVDEHSASGERTWSLALEASGGLHALAVAASPQGITTVAGSFKGETKELREAGAGRVKGFGKTDAFVWRLRPAPQRKPR